MCPGYTETDIVRDAVANIVAKTGRSEEQARAELAKSNPQKRLVQPAEVANAVAWLCLPGSESITGQAISVVGRRDDVRRDGGPALASPRHYVSLPSTEMTSFGSGRS